MPVFLFPISQTFGAQNSATTKSKVVDEKEKAIIGANGALV